MAKPPTILKSIPSGKRLSDVIDAMTTMNVLLSALIADLVRQDPDLKERMLFDLKAILSFGDLSPQFKKAYDQTIALIESLPITQR